MITDWVPELYYPEPGFYSTVLPQLMDTQGLDPDMMCEVVLTKMYKEDGTQVYIKSETMPKLLKHQPFDEAH